MGFRGAAPGWPYAGRGWYPDYYGTPAYPYPETGQTDIEDLKSQAEAMREQLARVEEQIKKMTSKS
jgi:hypothetical protein